MDAANFIHISDRQLQISNARDYRCTKF